MSTNTSVLRESFSSLVDMPNISKTKILETLRNDARFLLTENINRRQIAKDMPTVVEKLNATTIKVIDKAINDVDVSISIAKRDNNNSIRKDLEKRKEKLLLTKEKILSSGSENPAISVAILRIVSAVRVILGIITFILGALGVGVGALALLSGASFMTGGALFALAAFMLILIKTLGAVNKLYMGKVSKKIADEEIKNMGKKLSSDLKNSMSKLK